MPKPILLKPTDIEAEYGIKKRALAYMRECTIDKGTQVGPVWINPKDTNIYLYRRESIEEWLIRDTVKFDVPAKTYSISDIVPTSPVISVPTKVIIGVALLRKTMSRTVFVFRPHARA